MEVFVFLLLAFITWIVTSGAKTIQELMRQAQSPPSDRTQQRRALREHLRQGLREQQGLPTIRREQRSAAQQPVGQQQQRPRKPAQRRQPEADLPVLTPARQSIAEHVQESIIDHVQEDIVDHVQEDIIGHVRSHIVNEVEEDIAWHATQIGSKQLGKVRPTQAPQLASGVQPAKRKKRRKKRRKKPVKASLPRAESAQARPNLRQMILGAEILGPPRSLRPYSQEDT